LLGPIGKAPKEAEEKTLLCEWRSVPKKCLTGPTLLEMSGNPTNRALAPNRDKFKSVTHRQ
jgi:hypothetical protein